MEEQSAAGERAVICVPEEVSDEVTDALIDSAHDRTREVDIIRIHDTSHVFTYKA
jgi:hypothetical protein